MRHILALLLIIGWVHAENRTALEINHWFDSKSYYDRGELNLQYLNSKKGLQEDEFANNLKRKNYLKDRLTFQYGFGSKYGFQVDPASKVRFGVGQGFGVEYITRSGLSAFVGWGGFVETQDETASLAGVESVRQSYNATRFGLAYHFLPKIPLHPGIAVSYGPTLVGHKATPTPTAYESVPSLDPNEPATLRKISEEAEIVANYGFNIDASITYLDYGWYYLTLNVGIGITTENNSLDPSTEKPVVRDGSPLLEDRNVVFGFGGGIALADLLPDLTEKRRRERARARKKYE